MTDEEEALALWKRTKRKIWLDADIEDSVLSSVCIDLRCGAAWESSDIMEIFSVVVRWQADTKRTCDIESNEGINDVLAELRAIKVAP